MPGLIDTHWHHWTKRLPAVRAQRRSQARLFSRHREVWPALSGGGFLPERPARPCRGAGRRYHHDAQLVPQYAKPGARRRRNPRHARAWHPRALCLWQSARRAEHRADGPGRSRPRQARRAAADGLVTLGICSRNIGDDSNPTRGTVSIEMAKREWSGARELGLPITLHASGPQITKLLDGPACSVLTCSSSSDGTSAEDRAILAAKGVSYSMSPIGESRRPGAAGVIQLGELIEAGVKVSLSIDHVTTYNCDLFVGMRLLYSMNLNRLQGKTKIATKRLVELATIDGARDLGIADKVGSLAPGKRADLILVRSTDINMAPIGDPYDAMVFLAQPGNIDTRGGGRPHPPPQEPVHGPRSRQSHAGRCGHHRGVAFPRGLDVIDSGRARCAPTAMEDCMTMIPDRPQRSCHWGGRAWRCRLAARQCGRRRGPRGCRRIARKGARLSVGSGARQAQGRGVCLERLGMARLELFRRDGLHQAGPEARADERGAKAVRLGCARRGMVAAGRR